MSFNLATKLALRPSMALRTGRLHDQMPSMRSYSNKTKKPSVTSQFYRSFTRPIAKTLLIAVFTYQLAYWTWMKLETDEVRVERDETIAGLEKTVKEYDASTKKTS